MKTFHVILTETHETEVTVEAEDEKQLTDLIKSGKYTVTCTRGITIEDVTVIHPNIR